MKKFLSSVALVAAMMCSYEVAADDLPYLGADAKIAAEAMAQPANIPPGVWLVELERWFFNDDTFSARPITVPGQSHPGKRQGVLGFVSFYPFQGGHTLYSCRTRDGRDRFTSADVNCEGHILMTSMPITGYVASTQLPGTVPLYRCMRGGLQPNNWADHFDTLDVNCEKVRYPANDGVIGYIWL